MNAAANVVSTFLFENTIIVFILVFTRLAGLIMVAPGFGAKSTPIRVRAFLAVAVAVLITPMHAPSLTLTVHNLVHLSALVVREASIGLVMGTTVFIMFTSLQVTGQIIGHMSGLQLADTFDPSSNTTVSVFAKLLDVVALSVFLLIGGHRTLMAALLDSYHHLPPGLTRQSLDVVELLQVTISQSFEVGLRAAGPVMMALLLSVIVTGLISRTLPQLNILAIGFGINIMVLLGSLLFSIGAIIWLFQAQVDIAMERASFFFSSSVDTLTP
jgi:flagellar biosynthetic protein FliR